MTAPGHAPAARRGFGLVRAPILPLLVVMVIALLGLFEKEWRRGEVFSPADLVFDFYPWSYDAPRETAVNPTRSDEAFYHQPLMASHFARLRDGEFPDYDDTRLAGVPGFFQGLDVGRAFSPFSLPFYLLPAADAVNWYGPLRLLVAAVAMWLFLRELGVHPVAAAVGGIAFGLNGHFLTWLSAPMPTVAAWLPLVLRQVRRCVRSAGWLDVAGLAVALGVLFLGSYMATTLVCLFAAGVYGLVELWIARRDAVDGTAAVVPVPRALTALAAGGVLGLCIGAVALVPMLASLRDSPAGVRVVSPEGAPWPNLATLALPDFWGSPVRGNWWHPDASANYPEHIAYLGVVVALLAGLGLAARLPRSLSLVRWCFAVVTLIGLTRAYGGYPGRWLLVLPGQAQSNPFRWYALAACGVAVLAGLGLHALLTEPDRRRRLWQLAGPVAIGIVLAAVSAAALATFLPDIRARNLQGFERLQLLRFALLATATLICLVACAWSGSRRVRTGAGLILAALVAVDLVQAHRRFNPSVPRDRYYPLTPSLEWLQAQSADARIAPVDGASELVEGHVWSLFGLSAVTGFDFHGDRDYQAYMRIAQMPRPDLPAAAPPGWTYVGLQRDSLDLRMLGVLGARYVVTAPVDAAPRTGGYVPLGPLGNDQAVVFTVPVRSGGLRGIDLLTATYGRVNAGYWVWSVADEAGRVFAEGRVVQAELPNNQWWRLTWPPIEDSAGRRITLTVRSEGTRPGEGATFWATGSPSPLGTTLAIDGQSDARSLWFRTFADAPARFGEATLVHARDLNVYRNPHARPRAWFVERVNLGHRDQHASAMHTRAFDPAREAWLEEHPAQAPTTTARVTSISLSDDQRTIGVEAPEGGLLIVGER
ncbi:MAG TPA: hypothetical protein VMF13_22220, partial [Luteitalea sp.]|nr:hypothetical protein [Luteitalea sp.]